MKKSNLSKRIAAYEKMVSGSTTRGLRVSGVNTAAYHKPGSNKK